MLAVLAQLGAGADIVSYGELFRWMKAGGDPGKVVFSGVGKTETVKAQALKAGIYAVATLRRHVAAISKATVPSALVIR